MKDLTGQYCIVRGSGAGVYAATILSEENGVAEMENARLIHYWSGAASTMQIAMEGVARPGDCLITMIVPYLKIMGVVAIIPATEAAKKNIAEVALWKI